VKKPNIFKGRTKEWDSSEWQGRSKKQVESNEKTMAYAFLITLIAIIGYGIVYSIIHLFG